jgi:hypothetical protein
MGTFRPVELLELTLDAEGRPTLEEFRPRAPRQLDSAAYPGLLPVVPFNQIVRRIAERRQMTLW